MDPNKIPERPPGDMYTIRELPLAIPTWTVVSPTDQTLWVYHYNHAAKTSVDALNDARRAAWAECRMHAIGMERRQT